MAVLRAITFVTDVSIFALNLTVAMGLALAIDYTLLIISRYRDELAEGADRDRALVRTMATAGRTVLFSALTVALSMVAMVLFPMYFLKSFAYAGIAVVAFAAVAAIVVAPAAIVLLGDRLDSLDVRRLARRVLGRPEPVRKPVEQTFWYRSTKFVMRRAIPIGLAIVALLLVLGAPFLGAKWGFPDDRVLPQSLSARQVGDELRNNFAVDSARNVTVVIPDTDRHHAGRPRPLRRGAVAGARRVVGVGARRDLRRRQAGRTAVGGHRVQGRQRVPDRGSTAPLFTDASEAQLDRLHAVSTPAGQPVQLTGVAQINRDSSEAITSRLPTGSRGHRRDHLRAAVPAHRQRGVAAESVGAQRLIADRRVRRAGVDLPGRPPRRAGHHTHRNAGRQHAGAVVLHRVRAVDGLRGVPGLADPRVLAASPARPGRTTTKASRSAWPGPAASSPPRHC